MFNSWLHACVAIIQVCSVSMAGSYVSIGKGLTALPTDIPSDVDSIDLSHNEIVEIPPNSLSRFTRLTSLILKGNLIKHIEPSVFLGTNIVDLDLSSNKLERIPPLIAIGNSLQRLNLEANPLLSNNPLGTDILKFQTLMALTLVNVGYSSMISLDFLAHNALTVQYISAGHTDVTNINFNGFKMLKGLIMDGSMIADMLTNQTFGGCTQLSSVDISDVGMTQFPLEALKTIRTSLQILHISENSITDISPDAFEGFTALSEVHFYNNGLTTLPIFQSGTLQYFDIRANNLTYITPMAFDSLNNLRVLLISYNPGLETFPQLGSAVGTIEELDISDTGLTVIPQTEAMKFVKLSILRAGGISNFFDNMANFTYFPALESLVLNNVFVGSVNLSLFEAHPSLDYFSFNDAYVGCLEEVSNYGLLRFTTEHIY